jgi:Cell wall-active antibiotics response LiaF, C-terminal
VNQRTVALLIVGAIALFLVVAAVVAGLVIGGVIGAIANKDGGIQVRTEQPTSVQGLKGSYDIGAGSLELNLGKLDLPEGTTDVQAHVGDGALTVVVPKDVSIRVEAKANDGALSILGKDSSGEDLQRSYIQQGYPQAARRLTLDLSVDKGVISVQRAD